MQSTVTIALDEFEMTVGKSKMLIGMDGLWASVDVEVDTVYDTDHEVTISQIWVGHKQWHNHQDMLCPKEYGWLYDAAEDYAKSIEADLTLQVYEEAA